MVQRSLLPASKIGRSLSSLYSKDGEVVGTELVDTCAGLLSGSAKYTNDGVSTCTKSNLTTNQEMYQGMHKVRNPTKGFQGFRQFRKVADIVVKVTSGGLVWSASPRKFSK